MIVLFLVTILVSALWQPAVIAAIAWLILRLSRCSNATTRHAIWTVALVASVVLPLVSAAPLLIPTPTALPVTQSLPLHQTPIVQKATQPSRLAAVPAARPLTVERPHFHVRATFAQIAASVWGVAALLILGRLAFSFLYLERLKHDALPLPVERRNELTRWDRAEKGMRDVRICVTDEISVPVAVGIFDAMILLPRDLVEELEPTDLDRILLHELAHVRRSDDWVNLFERIALALFFFSPAMYVIARQMDLEREVACDDWVLAQAAENVPYARCLTRIVEMTQWPHDAVAAPGVFVTRKSMSIRIERLLARGRDVRLRLAVVPSSISVVAIAAIVIAGGFVSPTIAYTMDATAVSMTPPASPKPQPSRTKSSARTAKGPTVKPTVNVQIHAVDSKIFKESFQNTWDNVSKNMAANARAGRTLEVVANSGYLDDLAAAGFKNLSADDVIQMKSVGVDGEYVRSMRDAGVKDLTPRSLVMLKSMGITPHWISNMRAAGFDQGTASHWAQLKSIGVDNAYIIDMNSVGLTHLSTDDLMQLKSLNVTGDYIRDIWNAGYGHLSPREYVELKALNVNGDYIRNLSRHINGLTIQKIVELKAEGVDPQ